MIILLVGGCFAFKFGSELDGECDFCLGGIFNNKRFVFLVNGREL